MKNFKTIIALAILINCIHCKAQTYPLNTWRDEISQGGYVKDLNNELNPFIGVYKAVYEGNEMTLYISKVEDKIEKIPGKTYYTDALVVKYKVKNSSGVVIKDTQSSIDNKFYSIWSR